MPTVTVFATVGFGDIVATSQIAWMLVTAEVVADLVLIGLIAKVLLGAVQRRRRDLDGYKPEPTAPIMTGSPPSPHAAARDPDRGGRHGPRGDEHD